MVIRCFLALGLAWGLATAPSLASADPVRVEQLNEVERELKQSLNLSISERGPYQPWVVRFTNNGKRHVRLVADARLLWFEAKVPGKKKPQVCRVPEDMLPKRVNDAFTVRLAPRESFQLRVDPRFYCFEEGDQSLLVPGAQLTPHFGWPEKTKTVWRKGKRVELRGEQQPPFVAQLARPPGPQRKGAPGPPPQGTQAENAVEEPKTVDPRTKVGHIELLASEAKRGLKQVDGQVVALNTSYIVWSKSRLGDDTQGKKRPPLELEVVRGSDSRTARGARVTVKLTNRDQLSKTVFVRREHLNFLLMGPDGVVICPAPDEERAPDKQAFTRLGPGKSIRLVTRILEFCPNQHLDRPGFYLVAAELNLTEDGSAADLDAYTGQFFSTRLRPLRIRKGEQPFVYRELPTLREARRQLAEPKHALGERRPSQAIGKPFRRAKGSRPSTAAGAQPAATQPAAAGKAGGAAKPAKPSPSAAPTPPPSATKNRGASPH